MEIVQPEEDNYLENHVIKSLMVDIKGQNFSYVAVDGNKSLSSEPEIHDSCPKHSTTQLFLFRTFNNSLFIMMDNLFKEKYLNSPVVYQA